MAGINQETKLSITEQRILRTPLERWFLPDSPRVCSLQIRQVETNNGEVEAKRKALEEASCWDYEDYDEPAMGARPEGVDPKADVLVCGIGGCAVRIFKDMDGGDIQTGDCIATDYCLKDRFEAVQEGQALYGDILETCDAAGPGANSCPNLSCNLSAGVSEDMVPGTHGVCSKRK